MLKVKAIRKGFVTSKDVVRGVSFTVGKGEIYGFLGPNGAGKTTTIKIVAGLLVPDSGYVRIGGCDPHSDTSAMLSLGTILEGNRNLYWRMTAFENLRYFGVHKRMSMKAASDRADELLERFDLFSKRNAQVRTLSRGMQQKLAIAVSLIHEPKVLLLDEPTLGLDVVSTVQVIKIIRELRDQGIAIVLTTHQLDIAEKLSDRIAVIRDGVIVKEATTPDLIDEFSPDNFEIELASELCADRRDKLVSEFGAQIELEKVRIPGNADRLYEALDVIRPIPIKSLGRSQADLAQIFLRLTNEGHKRD